MSNNSIDCLSIFTDGACLDNANAAKKQCPTGWGVVILSKHSPSLSSGEELIAELFGTVELNSNSKFYLGAEIGSNNTAELTGMIEALLWIENYLLNSPSPRQIQINYDSDYAAKSVQRIWNGKKNRAMLDRGQSLLSRVQTICKAKIEFQWVKGHAGNRWNERADQLATTAARTGCQCSVGRFSESPSSSLPSLAVSNMGAVPIQRGVSSVINPVPNPPPLLTSPSRTESTPRNDTVHMTSSSSRSSIGVKEEYSLLYSFDLHPIVSSSSSSSRSSLFVTHPILSLHSSPANLSWCCIDREILLLFNYDSRVVDIIRDIPTARYETKDKTWRFHDLYLPEMIIFWKKLGGQVINEQDILKTSRYLPQNTPNPQPFPEKLENMIIITPEESPNDSLTTVSSATVSSKSSKRNLYPSLHIEILKMISSDMNLSPLLVIRLTVQKSSLPCVGGISISSFSHSPLSLFVSLIQSLFPLSSRYHHYYLERNTDHMFHLEIPLQVFFDVLLRENSVGERTFFENYQRISCQQIKRIEGILTENSKEQEAKKETERIVSPQRRKRSRVEDTASCLKMYL